MGLVESILARLFPPLAEPLAHVERGDRVLVRGTIVPRDLVTSPLGGQRCVYYRYLIEEWRGSSASEGFWVVIETDEVICEFYLQDETDRVVVAPAHARVIISAREFVPVVVPETTGRPRRGREFCLLAGQRVEVQGQVEVVDDLLDDARGYRKDPVRLLLRHPNGDVLRIRPIS